MRGKDEDVGKQEVFVGFRFWGVQRLALGYCSGVEKNRAARAIAIAVSCLLVLQSRRSLVLLLPSTACNHGEGDDGSKTFVFSSGWDGPKKRFLYRYFRMNTWRFMGSYTWGSQSPFYTPYNCYYPTYQPYL